MAATNGEITITKSSPGLGSSSSNSSHPNGPHLVPQIKLSPSSMQMSPTGSDCSKNDFLDDNPSKYTIFPFSLISFTHFYYYYNKKLEYFVACLIITK